MDEIDRVQVVDRLGELDHPLERVRQRDTAACGLTGAAVDLLVESLADEQLHRVVGMAPLVQATGMHLHQAGVIGLVQDPLLDDGPGESEALLLAAP